ncbi:hypothetical protein [Rufibacter sp. XAAS-G3-1]|uniref:hypothetical protein n=1 Tax=Rufibacter sp. XAAS-G3-1 TaxID=2729134 RepID=UPI0015E71CB4|nr:hypothetical protein [Rufibacter sp. XAAS-G3-1]
MITARDLLYQALDYDGFWNTSKSRIASRPSQLRKLQLEKLLVGFGISKVNAKSHHAQVNNEHTIQMVDVVSGHHSKSMNRTEYIKTLNNFKYFSTGEFIADASKEKYQGVIDGIISTAKSIFPEQLEKINEQPVNLTALFRDLYHFRLSIYHMAKYDFSKKRMKLFSIEDDYALYLRTRFIESMDANLSEVDEIVCLLIDPEKRSLEENEIDYPNHNFEIIDKEWENKSR